MYARENGKIQHFDVFWPDIVVPGGDAQTLWALWKSGGVSQPCGLTRAERHMRVKEGRG